MRIEVRRIESVKKSGEAVGNKVRAKIVKNKVAPPFTEAEFEITFGHGIDFCGEVVDVGVDLGLINKSGAWFALPDGTKIGQGRDNTKQWLIEHPEKFEEIKNAIYAQLFSEVSITEHDEFEEVEDFED